MRQIFVLSYGAVEENGWEMCRLWKKKLFLAGDLCCDFHLRIPVYLDSVSYFLLLDLESVLLLDLVY